MTLTKKTVARIRELCTAIDAALDAARWAIANQDAAAALKAIRRAEELKRRVVDLCPVGVTDVYQTFYLLDMAAETALSWPDDGVLALGPRNLDDLLENLEQSLADVEAMLASGINLPEETEALGELRDWLRQMIEHLKSKAAHDADPTQPQPTPRPDGGLTRVSKAKFLNASDDSGVNEGLFFYLEGLDRRMFCAGLLLLKDPPDWGEADAFLRLTIENKHLMEDWLGELAPTLPDGPPDKPPGPGDPGYEDLPPVPPDHASVPGRPPVLVAAAAFLAGLAIGALLAGWL